jgi:hypothetical protein
MAGLEQTSYDSKEKILYGVSEAGFVSSCSNPYHVKNYFLYAGHKAYLIIIVNLTSTLLDHID